MELTIFAKKRKSHEGKEFYSYLTSLTRKDGSTLTTAVRFRDDSAPKPSDCPCNIVVEKKNANLATSEFVREDTGEIATSYTLWVKAWTPGGAYVDKSLDDFV